MHEFLAFNATSAILSHVFRSVVTTIANTTQPQPAHSSTMGHEISFEPGPRRTGWTGQQLYAPAENSRRDAIVVLASVMDVVNRWYQLHAVADDGYSLL